MDYIFYNEDCITGAKKYLADESVDLIITDPPYGIEGDKLDKHYNRNEDFVMDGYVEVPLENYAKFSSDWICEAERVLKPGGAIYIVSGYTNLIHILNALANTKLEEINHIIWKYNFGVYTKTKYVSSHYHILYYVKPGAKHVFNTFSRYADSERENGGSANYQDREDVWVINREYKPGKVKNKNELPTELLIKMIQYSSNEADVVCDFFLGGFSTANVAKGLNRKAVGFEMSKTAYEHKIQEFNELERGYLLDKIRSPAENKYFNSGSPITSEERQKILESYASLVAVGATQKNAINQLSEKFGRGYFSLLNIINKEKANSPQQDLIKEEKVQKNLL